MHMFKSFARVSTAPGTLAARFPRFELQGPWIIAVFFGVWPFVDYFEGPNTYGVRNCKKTSHNYKNVV